MREAAEVPVTVKTRIGIDDCDDYGFLATFVETVAGGGCEHFIVHARKAVLAGLSPKQNRSIPPLRYEFVYRLKRDFPDLLVTLNGGVETVDAVRAHLEHVDAVMIGRKAYSDPWFLTRLQVEGPAEPRKGIHTPSRGEIVRKMAEYAQRQLRRGARLHHISRHMLGLYAGYPGSRRWRRYVSEHACLSAADERVLLDSLTIFDAAA